MTEKAPDIVGFILKTYLAIERSYNLLLVLYRLLYISYPTRYYFLSVNCAVSFINNNIKQLNEHFQKNYQSTGFIFCVQTYKLFSVYNSVLHATSCAYYMQMWHSTLISFFIFPGFWERLSFFTFPLQLIWVVSTTTTPVSTTTIVPCYILYYTKKQIIMHKCVCFRIKCFFVKLFAVVEGIYFADLLSADWARFVINTYTKKLLSISCGIIVSNLFGWHININQSMHSIDGFHF